MKISKELLSEVLGYKVVNNVLLLLEDEVMVKLNFEYFQTKYENDEINVYELQHLCKEWAFSEGYQLEISRYWNIPTYYCKLVIRGGDFCEECGESRAIYELEDLQETDIVVKACEWILNEKQLQR